MVSDTLDAEQVSRALINNSHVGSLVFLRQSSTELTSEQYGIGPKFLLVFSHEVIVQLVGFSDPLVSDSFPFIDCDVSAVPFINTASNSPSCFL
jgi:hypothetical protein